jgi:hypothetical protein
MSSSINTSRPMLYWKISDEISHTCDVCGFLLRDNDDYVSNKNHNACSECVDTYYYPNSDAWNNGWRPNLKGKNEQ